MKRVSVVAVVCLAAACGASESEPCTVVDSGSSVTITCPDGTSATVNDGAAGTSGQNGAAGTNGANGTNGADGQDGDDGADGIDNHIVASIFCQGPLPSTSLFVTYSAALTAAGDIFVRASVRNGLFENDASAFYAAGQNGASTANVQLQYDVAGTANGGWWNIGLDRSTLVQVVVYNDADVSGGQGVWTKDSSECIVNSYP